MVWKESDVNWLVQVLYYNVMFFCDKPFQSQLGVIAFLESHEWILSEDGA